LYGKTGVSRVLALAPPSDRQRWKEEAKTRNGRLSRFC
jgi:hypothetical protein